MLRTQRHTVNSYSRLFAYSTEIILLKNCHFQVQTPVYEVLFPADVCFIISLFKLADTQAENKTSLQHASHASHDTMK